MKIHLNADMRSVHARLAGKFVVKAEEPLVHIEFDEEEQELVALSMQDINVESLAALEEGLLL